MVSFNWYRLLKVLPWIAKLLINYLIHAGLGVFKVLWHPHHAPTALTVMLASFLDAKYGGEFYFGQYSDLIHLSILLSPFIYFYRIGKTKYVVKEIIIKERPIVSNPIKPPVRFDKQQIKEFIFRKKRINQPESYTRHMGDEFKDAKEVNYREIKK